VWDLVCFLPRAAHPFGPPCYAERAVPELADRVEWWLARPTTAMPAVVGDRRRRGDTVVISAHSLGGVLAVAALLRIQAHTGSGLSHYWLLTYGSQLRAYFSRMFPELLGPEVLGIPPVRSASLWTPDPWRAAKQDVQNAVVPPGSIAALFERRSGKGADEPGWRSLWRQTDYLGFPVWSFAPDPDSVDRRAEEIDETSYLVEVLTHSNYPRTGQYYQALVRVPGVVDERQS
jgi:hypothetical protein